MSGEAALGGLGNGNVPIGLSPFTGASAKPPLETGIKETEMIEATPFGHVDYFHVRVAQQRDSLQQAHFHAQAGHGKSKMLMKEPIKMPATATEFSRQFPHREGQDFFGGELLENLNHVDFHSHKSAALGVRVLEFHRQNSRDEIGRAS